MSVVRWVREGMGRFRYIIMLDGETLKIHLILHCLLSPAFDNYRRSPSRQGHQHMHTVYGKRHLRDWLTSLILHERYRKSTEQLQYVT